MCERERGFVCVHAYVLVGETTHAHTWHVMERECFACVCTRKREREDGSELARQERRDAGCE